MSSNCRGDEQKRAFLLQLNSVEVVGLENAGAAQTLTLQNEYLVFQKLRVCRMRRLRR